jgi:hypothetical protein
MSLVHVARWQAAGKLFTISIPFPQGFRLVYVGYFFNQVLPSSFGGDIIRAWAMHQEGAPWSTSAGSIFLDRLVGLFTLVLLYVLFYPMMRSMFELVALDLLWAILMTGLIGLFILFFSIRWWGPWVIKRVPSLVTFVESCKSWKIGTVLQALGYGVIIHFGIGLTFYILAQGLGIPLHLATALLLFPLINLITMVPLSFAGWGIREGVLVATLPTIGIVSESAFVLSISYGVILTLSALPGIALWFKTQVSLPHKSDLKS